MISIENLQRIPIFVDLTIKESQEILPLIEEIRVPKETVIFRQGDFSDALYFVHSGRLSVMRVAEGKEQDLGEKKPMDFFGVTSIILQHLRKATITSITNCVLYKISRTAYQELLLKNTAIAGKMMQFLVRNSLGYRDDAAEGKVIAFFSPKGGAGKTFFAANFACMLAKMVDARVLLADLSLDFGGVRDLFNQEKGLSIGQLLAEPAPYKFDTIEPYIVNKEYGKTRLGLLLAPDNVVDAAVTRRRLTRKVLHELIEELKTRYQFIVLDLPSEFSDVTVTALALSDRILMVLTSEYPCVFNAFRFLEAEKGIKEFQQFGREPFRDRTRIVMNLFRHGTSPQDLEKILNIKVHYTFPIIDQLFEFQEKPLFIEKKGNMEAVNTLIKMINENANVTVPLPKEGFLSWGR